MLNTTVNVSSVSSWENLPTNRNQCRVHLCGAPSGLGQVALTCVTCLGRTRLVEIQLPRIEDAQKGDLRKLDCWDAALIQTD